MPTAIALGLALCQPFKSAPAQAEPLSEPQGLMLEARLAKPVMKDGVAGKNYLRVGLGGCRAESNGPRTPVNIAFVIDRSGSMSGNRIAQAREAAIMAVQRLQGTDIAAVVTFDHQVDVLIPSRPVTDAGLFAALIRRIEVGGSTAIHAGVLAGAAEVRKFKADGKLNRVVLLSDGLANVGPSRPGDFAALGRELITEGVSVSTVGLGLVYNEDLMLTLARASDGNHFFAREPADLVQIFNRELNDVLASCAQSVAIDIELKPGVRAVKALSRDGKVEGTKAQFRLSQVYAAAEHYVLLEVEIDAAVAAAGEQDLGTVKVAYTQGAKGEPRTLTKAVLARFTASEAEIAAAGDTKVTEAVMEQVVLERGRAAVALRDRGKYEEAQKLLQQNATEIDAYAAEEKAQGRAVGGSLVDLGKQYKQMGAAPPPKSATEAGEQRKSLRALEAPSPGSKSRY
jgi:Ca-activated chloride channel family protein